LLVIVLITLLSLWALGAFAAVTLSIAARRLDGDIALDKRAAPAQSADITA
jgi:hypothetical protein